MPLVLSLLISLFLVPVRASATAVLTNSAGAGASLAGAGSVVWSTPGSVTLPDGANAVATTSSKTASSEYLQATSLGFNIPDGSIIQGIVVRILRSASASSGKWWTDSEVRIVKGGVIGSAVNRADTTTPWPTVPAAAVYGGSADLWGETWTTADITNSDFGVAISVAREGTGGGSLSAYVDHIEIDVYYQSATFTLNVSSEHGTPTPAGLTTNNYNDLVNASVASETIGSTQFLATGWVGSGSIASGSGTNTSFNITSDSTIVWLWTTNFWLDTETNGIGAIDVSDAWLASGSNITINASPDTGYIFAGWTGDINTNSNPLSFTMDQAYTITANFEIASYSLIASAGPNGSITPQGTVMVDHGAGTNFIVTADPHYHIASIKTNGVLLSYSYDNTLDIQAVTWDNVTGTGTITATFAENLWDNDTPETWLDAYYPGTSDYDLAALSDTDGDGLSASEEYIVGSDPTDATSVLAVPSLNWESGSNSVSWLSYANESGATYRIDRSTNLLAGTWEVASGGIVPTPPMNTYSELDPYPDSPTYYRVVATNAP